jgi:hypothetical protein
LYAADVGKNGGAIGMSGITEVEDDYALVENKASFPVGFGLQSRLRNRD